MWQNGYSSRRSSGLTDSAAANFWRDRSISRGRTANSRLSTSESRRSSGATGSDRISQLKNRYEANKRTSTSLSPLRPAYSGGGSYVPSYIRGSGSGLASSSGLSSSRQVYTPRSTSREPTPLRSQVENRDRLLSPTRTSYAINDRLSSTRQVFSPDRTQDTSYSTRTRLFSPERPSYDSSRSRLFSPERTTQNVADYSSYSSRNRLFSPERTTDSSRNRLFSPERTQYSTSAPSRSRLFSQDRTSREPSVSRLFSPERITTSYDFSSHMYTPSTRNGTDRDRTRLFSTDSKADSALNTIAKVYRTNGAGRRGSGSRRNSIASDLEARRDSLSQEIHEFQNLLKKWDDKKLSERAVDIESRNERGIINGTASTASINAKYRSIASRYLATKNAGKSSSSESESKSKSAARKKSRAKTQKKSSSSSSGEETKNESSANIRLKRRRKRLQKSRNILQEASTDVYTRPSKPDKASIVIPPLAQDEEPVAPKTICLNYLDYWKDVNEERAKKSEEIKSQTPDEPYTGAKPLISSFETGVAFQQKKEKESLARFLERTESEKTDTPPKASEPPQEVTEPLTIVTEPQEAEKEEKVVVPDFEVLGPLYPSELSEALTEMTKSFHELEMNQEHISPVFTPSRRWDMAARAAAENIRIIEAAIERARSRESLQSPGSSGSQPSPKSMDRSIEMAQPAAKPSEPSIPEKVTMASPPAEPRATKTPETAKRRRIAVVSRKQRYVTPPETEEDSNSTSVLRSPPLFEIKSITSGVGSLPNSPKVRPKIRVGVTQVTQKDSGLIAIPAQDENNTKQRNKSSAKREQKEKLTEATASLKSAFRPFKETSEELVVKIVDPAKDLLFKVDRSLKAPAPKPRHRDVASEKRDSRLRQDESLIAQRTHAEGVSFFDATVPNSQTIVPLLKIAQPVAEPAKPARNTLPFRSERRAQSYHPHLPMTFEPQKSRDRSSDKFNSLPKPQVAVVHEPRQGLKMSAVPVPGAVINRRSSSFVEKIPSVNAIPPPDQEIIDLLNLGDGLSFERQKTKDHPTSSLAPPPNVAPYKQTVVTMPKTTSQRAVQMSMEDFAKTGATADQMVSSVEFSGSSRPDSTIPTDPASDVYHSSESLTSALRNYPKQWNSSRESVHSIPQDPVFAKTMTPKLSMTPEMRPGHTIVRVSPFDGRSGSSKPLDTATRHINRLIDQQTQNYRSSRSIDRERSSDRSTRFARAMKQLDAVYETLQQECEGEASRGRRGRSELPERQKSYQPTYVVPKTPERGWAGSLDRFGRAYQSYKTEELPRQLPVASPERGYLQTATAATAAKMDFTQKWLEGDLSSWKKSDAQMIPPQRREHDEESLGSGSAEVAGIFTGTTVSSKKSKTKSHYSAYQFPSESHQPATLPLQSQSHYEKRSYFYQPLHSSAKSLDAGTRGLEFGISYKPKTGEERVVSLDNVTDAKNPRNQFFHEKPHGVGSVKKKVSQIEHSSNDEASIASFPVRGRKGMRTKKLAVRFEQDSRGQITHSLIPKQPPLQMHTVSVRPWRNSTQSLPVNAGFEHPSLGMFNITEDPILEAARSPSPRHDSYNSFATAQSDRSQLTRSSTSTLVGSPRTSRKSAASRDTAPSHPVSTALRLSPLDDVANLVAELELNTEETELKRPRFPVEKPAEPEPSPPEESEFPPVGRVSELTKAFGRQEPQQKLQVNTSAANSAFTPPEPRPAVEKVSRVRSSYPSSRGPPSVSEVLRQVDSALDSLDLVKPKARPREPPQTTVWKTDVIESTHLDSPRRSAFEMWKDTSATAPVIKPIVVPRKKVYLTEDTPKPKRAAKSDTEKSTEKLNRLDQIDAHFADLFNYDPPKSMAPRKTVSQKSVMSVPDITRNPATDPRAQAMVMTRSLVESRTARNPVRTLFDRFRSPSRERQNRIDHSSTYSLDTGRIYGTGTLDSNSSRQFKGYDKHTTNSSFEYRSGDSTKAAPPPAKKSVRERMLNWAPWRR